MNPFSDIVGNKKSIDFFTSLIESKKLSHAYLLSGPSGSGKKKMALSIAAFLAKQSAGEAMCQAILKRFGAKIIKLSVFCFLLYSSKAF